MRIAVCALSAVLLSGCSWIGNVGQSLGFGAHNTVGHYGAKAPRGNPCQIPTPQHPIPRGCAPHQVTLATAAAAGAYAGGFSQQPQFGHPQAITGGYGSHAANAGAHAQHNGSQHKAGQPRLRKPKLRGSLSLGLEKSFQGDALDYSQIDVYDPLASYLSVPQITSTGTPADGLVLTGTYTGVPRTYNAPSISLDDVHSTPARIAGGLEYIMTPNTTVFANAGYSTAEGNAGGAGAVIGDIEAELSYQGFGAANSPVGDPFEPPVGILPNQVLSQFSYDFTDLRRYDLEVGARHYFKPVLGNAFKRSLTPFVSASVGAANINGLSYDVTQENLRLAQAYVNDTLPSEEQTTNRYDAVQGERVTVDLYDSQWLPTGQLNAGIEWQATPKTAIAFETGLKFEGPKDYVNGAKSDTNIAIPFTIRGSYNF